MWSSHLPPAGVNVCTSVVSDMLQGGRCWIHLKNKQSRCDHHAYHQHYQYHRLDGKYAASRELIEYWHVDIPDAEKQLKLIENVPYQGKQIQPLEIQDNGFKCSFSDLSTGALNSGCPEWWQWWWCWWWWCCYDDDEGFISPNYTKTIRCNPKHSNEMQCTACMHHSAVQPKAIHCIPHWLNGIFSCCTECHCISPHQAIFCIKLYVTQ